MHLYREPSTNIASPNIFPGYKEYSSLLSWHNIFPSQHLSSAILLISSCQLWAAISLLAVPLSSSYSNLFLTSCASNGVAEHLARDMAGATSHRWGCWSNPRRAPIKLPSLPSPIYRFDNNITDLLQSSINNHIYSI